MNRAEAVCGWSAIGFGFLAGRSLLFGYGATFWIAGGFQVPSRIAGGVSFGQ